MAHQRRRYTWLSAVLWIAGGLCLIAGLVVLQAEKKLSALTLGGLGERFSTRIWSAPFTINEGQFIDTSRIILRLERLSYHQVDTVAQKGDYHVGNSELTIFLRGFTSPFFDQKEGFVTLRRDDTGAWRIYDSIGNKISDIHFEPELAAQLSGEQKVWRDPLTWEQIPASLRDAVVAAEDKRFWTHWGIDPRAVLRAALANLRRRELQGASTITQQLSKNLFLSPHRTWMRKVSEAALAVYLERRFDKKRILTLYLNHIYLGQDGSSSIMGMRAAARYYFSKDPIDLTLAESATLAGIIRGPGFYSPFQDPQNCLARRNWVLKRMHEDGLISETSLAEALAQPLTAKASSTPEEHRDSAYFVSEVVRQLLPKYGGDVLFRNGLSVYTTMDPVLQSLAQKTMHLAKHQAALVAMDPKTADILAISGGRDFSTSQFNRATQAQRQPGSTFKPFIYAAALNMGLTANTILRDKPRVYRGRGKDWTPNNYDNVYFGTATMRQALTHSMNAATLDLTERVGVPRVIKMARDVGISSPLHNDLSLGLGTSEVNLLEITSAYQAFANSGQRASPRLIKVVVDAENNVLETISSNSTEVLDPNVAYLVTSLLQTVVKEGTARFLKLFGFELPAAGKTGTTNDGRDAWFVGYTSSLLTGVWTGADDNRALKLTGAKDALPLWAQFMREAQIDRLANEFERPSGIVESRICLISGLRARSGCTQKMDELFLTGTEPQQDCLLHRGGIMGWFDRLTKK